MRRGGRFRGVGRGIGAVFSFPVAVVGKGGCGGDRQKWNLWEEQTC